jgi:hypothetical protein
MSADIVSLHNLTDDHIALVQSMNGWDDARTAREWRRFVHRYRDVDLQDRLDGAWLYWLMTGNVIDFNENVTGLASAALGIGEFLQRGEQ